MDLVYMKDYPTVPVRCVVVERMISIYEHEDIFAEFCESCEALEFKPDAYDCISKGNTDCEYLSGLKYKFEKIFGEVNFVQADDKDAKKPHRERFYFMMASAEIGTLVMQNAECWVNEDDEQYLIVEAELSMQLLAQPAPPAVPSLYNPVRPTNRTSPFDALNIDCLIAVFGYLDFDSICNLAEADAQMHDFADTHVFARKTKYGFLPDYDVGRSDMLRHDLYFLGPHLNSVRISGFELESRTVHDITCVIQTCPKLKSLEICHYNLSIHDLIVLSRFKCPVKSLTLYKCDIRFKQWTDVVRNWPNFEELYLTTPRCENIKHLLEPCQNFRVFYAGRITQFKCYKDFIERNQNTLRSLVCVVNFLSFTDSLSIMLQCPYLEYVSIDAGHYFSYTDMCKIESLQLCKLEQLKHLKGVRIINWPFDLVLLEPLHNLESLTITTYLSHSSVKTLIKFSTVRKLELPTDVQRNIVIDILLSMPNLNELLLTERFIQYDRYELRQFALSRKIQISVTEFQDQEY